MNLLLYSNFRIGCLNTILLKDSLFLNVMKNILKIPSEVKDIVVAEVSVDTDLVMICFTTTTSTSNTLKDLLVNSNYHSSYTTQEFNTRKIKTSTIFNTHVTPQIKEINHPAFIKEWKLNIDATEYEKSIEANMYKPSEKEIYSC